MSEIILKLQNICKSFDENIIFQDYNMEIEQGSFVIVTGASGCGKSTLLNIIGLLDVANSGKITWFNESNIRPFSKKAEKLLHDKIGYVFQNFALIENETVVYNLDIIFDKKISRHEKEEAIRNVLKKVKLEGYEDKKIYKCSGGEQQRIALARLMLKPCELILADEPTGSLDQDNKKIIMELLTELNKQGKTILMVTHDHELFPYASRIITL